MAGPNLDQFENFFRRADLDGDGRISGAEAVGFFQGSGLPKQVLAQIWMHADQSHCGFLGRQEFYNALKLVTVAQSKRELTQDIVKAALYGPAAAKIPPPQINLPPSNTPQMGGVAPPASQNPGFRGPGLPNASMGQSYFPSQQNQQIRPLQQPMPAATAARPPQGIAAQEFSRGAVMGGQTQGMPAATSMRPPQALPTGTTGSSLPNQNISSNWLGGRTGGTLTGPGGMAPSSQPAGLQSQPGFSMPSQPTTNDSKALVVSGNGFSTDQAFGGDAFSAITVPSSSRQESPKPSFSPGSAPTSPDFLPPSSGAQLPVKKSNSLDSLQSAFSMQPSGVPIQRTHSSSDVGQQGTHSSLNLGHQLSTPRSPSITSSGISAGVGNSAPDNSQVSWPKMKPSDVQKYTKVFMEVDTDRDGKITGEQARNLFLSWRLPRDVLKQVWDLSDQDSDSMLSLREFCFALYLMERSREGRPLPAMLPRNVMFDETLLSMTGQPNVAHGNAAWAPNPGFGPQPGMGAQPHTTTPFRPPSPPTAIPANNNMMPSQQKPRAPVLDDSFGNQRDNGGQNSMFSPDQDAAADANTAGGTEKVILDSREKIEFYRSKMQDLVLYKSRCDNRLNEITERAIADKREAEMLAKKYEEKYKQVAEIASKLTIEEAKFRETQERKTELHHAIINMEQGGSADGILQVRADRIQSDLEELLKALTQRCKKHGYELKTTAVIELPVGWQPGIQEGAAVWDEEWDKFEDEGFGHELSVDVRNSTSVQKGEAPQDGSLTPDSSSYADDKHGNIFSAGERALECESAYTHSDDESARSPRGSSAGRHAPESPSDQYSDGPFRKSAEADSETHRSFDESAWGAFDNDDTDSVWGFNPTKDSDSHSHGDFFGGSSDFGVNTIRTDSPGAESSFPKRSPFFEDSVPSTPLSKFGNSPPRFSEAGNHFDSFSRFDSFNTHDSGFGQPERLTRFDSINSSKDFGHGFSFDDNDPFGTSGPFKVSSSDGHSPKKSSDNWNAF